MNRYFLIQMFSFKSKSWILVFILNLLGTQGGYLQDDIIQGENLQGDPRKKGKIGDIIVIILLS